MLPNQRTSKPLPLPESRPWTANGSAASLSPEGKKWNARPRIVLYHHWDEIKDWNNASAYDTSLRWAANKPWIRISTPQEIAGGQVDINSDGNGDSWHVIDRGSPNLPTVAHDWLQHATEDDYDNWYNGLNGIEEGLKNKVFESRPGTALPHAWHPGVQDGKLADLAWDAAYEITNKDSLASLLARTTAHISSIDCLPHTDQQ